MLAKILISPDIVARQTEIQKILTANFPTENHPDVFYLKVGEKMGIAQARTIITHLSTKPYSAKGKAVFIEDATNLTLDAQNTLLKTLEEPPEEAILILGVTSENDLLPTILSRCEIVILGTERTPESARDSAKSWTIQDDIVKLINSTIPERFAYIEKLKEKEEFLKALVNFYRHQLLQNPTQENKQFLEELMKAEKWFNSNVNQRAILEYIMLIMPTI